jgi:hypothetical protein
MNDKALTIPKNYIQVLGNILIIVFIMQTFSILAIKLSTLLLNELTHFLDPGPLP